MSQVSTPHAIAGHISVLDLDPDLLQHVAQADRQMLGAITLPVLDLSNDTFDVGWLADTDALERSCSRACCSTRSR